MKRIKQISLLFFVLFLLTACGSIPTDGLTGAMGVGATASEDPTTTEAFNSNLEISLSSCNGQWDPERNMLQMTFKPETDQNVYGNITFGELSLFGGSAALVEHVPTTAVNPFRLRCVRNATLKAIAFTGRDGSRNFVATIEAPMLRVESSAGQVRRLDNVSMDGLLAPAAEAIPEMLASIYGVSEAGVYEAYWAQQAALYQSYPDATAVRNLALSNGISEANANRFGQMYLEPEVAKRRALLLDIVTTENDQFTEVVIGATVDSLLAGGYTQAQIAAAFAQETNGRLTVKFTDVDPNAGSYPGVQVSDRSEDSVTVSVSQEKQESSGEAPPDDGGTPPDDGGTPPDDGGTPPDDGGTPPDDGETPPGGGGGDTPEDEPGFWEKLFNTLWDMLEGAAGGAGLGAGIGALIGGAPGAAVGAGIGAIIGAGKGAFGGFWAGPPGEDNPCNNPFVLC